MPDFGWDTGGLTGKEYFDKRGRDGILGKVDRALSGGKGFAKFGKKAGKKSFIPSNSARLRACFG